MPTKKDRVTVNVAHSAKVKWDVFSEKTGLSKSQLVSAWIYSGKEVPILKLDDPALHKIDEIYNLIAHISCNLNQYQHAVNALKKKNALKPADLLDFDIELKTSELQKIRESLDAIRKELTRYGNN